MTRRERERAILEQVQKLIDNKIDVFYNNEPNPIHSISIHNELTYVNFRQGGPTVYGPGWSEPPLTLKEARKTFKAYKPVALKPNSNL